MEEKRETRPGWMEDENMVVAHGQRRKLMGVKLDRLFSS